MKKLILPVAALAMLASSQAFAGLFLKMEDNGGASLTCADEALACDRDDGDVGLLSARATLNALDVTIATGQAEPWLSAPTLLSSNVNGTVTGVGVATVYVTVTDFNIAELGNLAKMSTSATTNTGVVATWDLLLDVNNGLFGGVSVADTLLNGNDSENTLASLIGGDDAFSLTLKTVITVTADDRGLDYDNLATVTDVPEPSILALLSAGLLGLGVAHRRTKK